MNAFLFRTCLFLIFAFFVMFLAGCPFLKPNNPPALPIPDQTVFEDGDLLELRLKEFAEDSDNDPLSFSMLDGDIGRVEVIDNDYFYLYQPDYGDAGEYEISIEVVDWREGRAQDSFIVTVVRFAEEPHSPIPSDNSTGVPIDLVLSWECPDPQEKLIHDVQFGPDASELVVIAKGIKDLVLEKQGLQHNTEYYWRIVIRDGKGGVIEGPVWSFKTIAAPELDVHIDIEVSREDAVEFNWSVEKTAVPEEISLDLGEEARVDYSMSLIKDIGTTVDSTYTVTVDLYVQNIGPSIAQDVVITLIIPELGVHEVLDSIAKLDEGQTKSYTRTYINKDYNGEYMASVNISFYNRVDLLLEDTAITPFDLNVVRRVDDIVTVYDEIGVPDSFSLSKSDTPSFPYTAGESVILEYAVILKNEGGLISDQILENQAKIVQSDSGEQSFADASVSVLVPYLRGIVDVAAGSAFSVALRRDGTVWTWGDNELGQLGNNTWTTSPVPVQVIGDGGDFLKEIVRTSAGEFHTVALRKDGTVWAWGCNGYGQLGDGTQESQNTAIQIAPCTLSGVIAVSAGGRHSMALRDDGTVWTWGQNFYGQLGDGRGGKVCR